VALAVTASQQTLRILVGDDQPAVLEAVRLVLKGEGHTSVTVDNPPAVVRAATSESFDLILIDLNYARDTTSGQEGLDLLASLQGAGVEAPVVVMTAWGSVELAVEAMRRGACDFIQKPWDNSRLIDVVTKQASEATERAAKQRRNRSEAEIARNVQQKLLPRPVRSLKTASYSALCCPAGDVGGDYYDFIDMAGGSMGFVLADVSGKGIGAALLMAHLQASLRTRLSQASASVSPVLEELNHAFFESTSVEHYATMVFGRYDDSARRFQYVNAGHLAPLVVRQSGTVERLDPTAVPIGVLPHWSSEERTVDIGPGDTLLVFSDGVAENGLEDGQEFGEEALAQAVIDRRGLTAEQLVHSIADLVLTSARTQHDDLTLLAIQGV
jgi:sigma-B regulation protein RsbU (phosphoserine phosphatase)